MNNYRFLTVIVIGMLILGSVFYHHVEKLSWLNAIYFSVITLATVGYGDIVPKTDAGKLFTIFYVLSGVGIIAAFAHSLVIRAAEKRERKRAKLEREKKQSIK